MDITVQLDLLDQQALLQDILDQKDILGHKVLDIQDQQVLLQDLLEVKEM